MNYKQIIWIILAVSLVFIASRIEPKKNVNDEYLRGFMAGTKFMANEIERTRK